MQKSTSSSGILGKDKYLYNSVRYITGGVMQKLVIKIGGKMWKDVENAFKNPSKALGGTHTLYLKNSEELYEILSPRRMDMLVEIINAQSGRAAIGELAQKLNRKQEAISRDAKLLTKYQLVEKVKEKQKVYLKSLYCALDLQLGSAGKC